MTEETKGEHRRHFSMRATGTGQRVAQQLIIIIIIIININIIII